LSGSGRRGAKLGGKPKLLPVPSGQVAGEIFKALDHYLWRLTWKWAVFSHPNRPKQWVFAHYFGRFNKARQDRWVFGHRASGAYLHRFGWTHIRRHQIVKHGASPDDPALTEYWTQRRRKTPLPINPTTARALAAQDGRCGICNGTLFADHRQPNSAQQWEQWLHNTRAHITIVRDKGTPEHAEYRLLHTDCHHRQPSSTAARQHAPGLV
jgi:RNA-directed DNA polymerase